MIPNAGRDQCVHAADPCNTAYGIVIWAMQYGAMGAVSALRETSVVSAAIIGRIFLREELTGRRIASCTAIAVGVAFLAS